MFTISNRNLLTILGILLAIGIVVAGPTIGFRTAIFGTIGGIFYLGISYFIKFSPAFMNTSGSTTDDDDNFIKSYLALLVLQVLMVGSVCSVWYSSSILFYNGSEQDDRVTSIRIDTATVGIKESRRTVTHYYCKLRTYPKEVACKADFQVGEPVKILASSTLGKEPGDIVIMRDKETRFEAILDDRGGTLYASIVYGACLLLTWFILLNNQGVQLLQAKLTLTPNETAKLLYHLFYYLGFFTFILFVLTLFKNIYNLVPFKPMNIAVVTGVFLIILLTKLGEKLFQYSTSVLLDLKSYKLLFWLKQISKIVGYVSLAIILYESLTTNEKSVYDIIAAFLEKHFDIDIKP